MNNAQTESAKYAAKMNLNNMPKTMEELAALQKKWRELVEANHDWEGSEEEVEMASTAAFAFTALTGVDFEEDLLMDYTLKATTPEIAAYMGMLLRRIMDTTFTVTWVAGYGEPASDVVSFREIIEDGNYTFESEELVELLALTKAGESWTYEAMAEIVLFTRHDQEAA